MFFNRLNEKSRFKEILDRLFRVNYFLMLINLSGFLAAMNFKHLPAVFFTLATLICYAFIYLIPAGLLITIAGWICRCFGLSQYKLFRVLVYAVAIVSLVLTHLFIFTDQFIYKLYSFHANGFVWNIILTKDGIQSLGAGTSTVVVFFLIIGTILLVEIAVLFISMRFDFRFLQKKPVWGKVAIAVLLLCFTLESIGFGICSFNAYAPVLVKAGAFPCYLPFTFRGQLEKLGFKPKRNIELTLKSQGSLCLNYPLKSLTQKENSTHYNIVWLVSESLAAPMLTDEIMPATWDFSQKSTRFLDHYSGGNGTRMGVFTMFYGLYGNYWFNCLNEQRSPVIMDLLQKDGYQIELFTSAAFTYPEFNKTVFARIPREHMHEHAASSGWESDRVNISLLLGFLEKRDRSKPFMTFMFFESPHAPYNFPPDTVIRPDYLKDFNYATTDIKKNIVQIKNRYINACRHLDTQIERVLTYLKDNSLLDSTIIIITGDHGQEFMEHGRWGHNSAFTQEQLRVPLVIWVPGKAPQQISRMTSHLDLPTTVLTQLGVTNPPGDYSLGQDLFGDEKSNFTVSADWNGLCYLDADCKIVMPLKSLLFTANKTTTLDDEPLDNPGRIFSEKKNHLMQVMKDSTTFSSKHK